MRASGRSRERPKTPAPKDRRLDVLPLARSLLLVATLVASLTKQLAVLLLRHALAALLDD